MTFELESGRRSEPSDVEVPRRRMTSKRTVGTNANTPCPEWDERSPKWDGSAWLPQRARAANNSEKKSRSETDNRRASRPNVDANVGPSSSHDPVVDPCVDDVPPLNARLAARKPTAQEVAEHNVTHLPYRAWCETCVASRGVDDPHKRRPFEDRMSEGEIDKVFFDFAFFRPRLAAPSIPILVAVSKRTGMRAACTVKDRQGRNPKTIQWVIRILKEMGHHGPVCLRSDGEPTIRFLLANVASSRRSITLLEHGPREDSQSNGRIERTVRSIEEIA